MFTHRPLLRVRQSAVPATFGCGLSRATVVLATSVSVRGREVADGLSVRGQLTGRVLKRDTWRPEVYAEDSLAAATGTTDADVGEDVEWRFGSDGLVLADSTGGPQPATPMDGHSAGRDR